MGKLIKELKKCINDLVLLNDLDDLLNKRNWIVHHYFRDRAGHFVTEVGIEVMHKELCELIAQAEKNNDRLSLLTRSDMEKIFQSRGKSFADEMNSAMEYMYMFTG